MRLANPVPGDVLDGRFLLGEEIGRGSMSTIFKAEDLAAADRRPVAVKIPLPQFSSGVGAWSIFQREEEIGRQLDHPFVLKFLPLPADKRRTYVVTEHVLGTSLAEHMDRHRPLVQAEALAIVSKVSAAVEHVHARGVVHYDVKPENVILCPDGSIRLIDFGLAHRVVTSRFNLAPRPPAIASATYIAPEQIKRQPGRRSADIYALGAMLYEMLTGRAPFPGDDPFVVASARLVGDPPAPRSVNPNVSREVEEIVLRALRRDSSERYASAASMRHDLDNPRQVVVSGLAERLSPVTRWRKLRRLARYAAFIAIVPIAAELALFALLWRHFAHGR